MSARALLGSLLLAIAAAAAPLCQAADAGPGGLSERAAVIMPGAKDAMMLSATRAGDRLVAVGDHGVVLLSDDDGKNFRQAHAVPTRATLTGVTFIDAREGWACGHWGVVLHTTDGGDTWALQRDDLQSDRPLWTLWFKDARHGLAAGLWGMVLRTEDGGAHWDGVPLPPTGGKSKPSDLNLLALFPGPQGSLLIAAEHGTVFRSDDEGLHWTELQTGNAGTFWAGATLKSGTVLVAGLRGHVFRSEDGGKHWAEVQTGNKSSITGLTELPDGRVIGVGLDGVALQSLDDGRSFSVTTRPDRDELTAVTSNRRGKPIAFSDHGPISLGDTAPANH